MEGKFGCQMGDGVYSPNTYSDWDSAWEECEQHHLAGDPMAIVVQWLDFDWEEVR